MTQTRHEDKKQQGIPVRREKLDKGHLERCSNPGLLLSSYLGVHDKKKEGIATLFGQVRDACKRNDLYEHAFNARRSRFNGHVSHRVTTDDNNRLIIGLGNASPLETGLTLNRLYGTPMIPGSALKGLCTHYARDAFFERLEQKEMWRERKPEDFSEGHYRFLFGDATQAGRIVFHDAWITPESLKSKGFCRDVITPHHQEYYRSKGKTPPTDFDSPVPVPFLSVAGVFEIVLTCGAQNSCEWLKTAWVFLESALEHWGIGGKTSSGYGRMIPEEKKAGGREKGRQ